MDLFEICRSLSFGTVLYVCLLLLVVAIVIVSVTRFVPLVVCTQIIHECCFSHRSGFRGYPTDNMECSAKDRKI